MFSYRDVIQWRVSLITALNIRSPFCRTTLCVCSCCWTGWCRYWSDKSRSDSWWCLPWFSLSVDGLIWCNTRLVVWGVLTVCLFLFVSYTPCVVMFSCFWGFFVLHDSVSTLNHLPSCFFFLGVFFSCSFDFITSSPSTCSGEWCECN